MSIDFLPTVTTTIVSPPSIDTAKPCIIPVGPMVRELRSSMAKNGMNVFSPPDNDFWHLFEWKEQQYSAHLYVHHESGETLVDIFPFASDSTLLDTPLVMEYQVARSIFMFPPGRA